MSNNTESKFIPLRVDQFQAGVKSPINLYARVGDNNYSVLFEAGEKPAQAKLIQHNGANITYLWIKPEEINTLSRHQISLANIALNSSRYDLQQKSLFVSKAVTTIFTEFSKLDLKISNYNLVHEVSKHTTNLIDSHSDLYEILENMSQSSEHLVKHSLTVSALSLVIGYAMGWRNPVTKEKLAVGGLLHKIGLLDLDPELQTTKFIDYSPTQLSEFKTYPHRGYMKLSRIGFVSDDIVSIVHQHRERAQGKGFPLGLVDSRIHPLARVVAVADALAYYLVPSINNNGTADSPEKAFKKVEDEQGHLLNKEIFSSFQKLLGRNSLKKDAI